MSSLSPKDRVSLCMFSFADGRRCRTPRIRNHPHFCYYHAEKEARARAAQSLGTDLARYFSGQYLSACDLSTALGCLIPAVIRGDVKPKVARTVAYMAQTLLQSIHISQHECINAFGTDAWHQSIRNSVHSNHRHRFPPHRSGGLQAGVSPQPQQRTNAQPQPQPSPPQTRPPEPAPPPHNPLPPTGAEFAQQLLAGRARSMRPSEAGEGPAPQATPPPAQSQPPAFTRPPSTPSPDAPSSPVCHPEPACAGRRSEGPHPSPGTHFASTTTHSHNTTRSPRLPRAKSKGQSSADSPIHSPARPKLGSIRRPL